MAVAKFCENNQTMPWNGSDYSWVGTGRTINMLFACTPYDPSQYAPIWYNRVGLVVICVANSLSIIAIALRTYFRWRKTKSFGKDDWWLIAAGVRTLQEQTNPHDICHILYARNSNELIQRHVPGTQVILVFIYFPALLVSNRTGSGLYVENIPFEDRQALWLSMSGWAFYFIIASMIKVATCMYYLRIIPDHRTRLQHFVYVLSTAIMIIGLVQAGVWVFNCSPVEANFIYNVEHMNCPAVDKARWSWIAFSAVIDSALLWIPWRILQHAGLPTAERRVLKLVFAANLLGTLTCIGNVYGVITFDGDPYYDSYGALDDDFTHSEAAFILINNAEVLMYVIGACFPVLSPYLVSLARSARSGSRNKSSTLPSWRVDIEGGADTSPHPLTIGRRESHPKRYMRDDDGLDTMLETVGVGISCDRAVTVMPTKSSRGRADSCVCSRNGERDDTMGALTPATVVVSLDSAVGMHMVKDDNPDSGVRVDHDGDVEMRVQVPAEVQTAHAHLRTRSDDGVRYGVGRRRSDGDLAAWKSGRGRNYN
ncbi:hypothetical protein TWF696_008474 [Orbilia brochopaga]|uniref:Rhodopsin domain-containing protein n=1 Tax=Orbilia brochopaga TaxID=3140254 RepID=A0AAV9UG22_9PEZI